MPWLKGLSLQETQNVISIFTAFFYGIRKGKGFFNKTIFKRLIGAFDILEILPRPLIPSAGDFDFCKKKT